MPGSSIQHRLFLAVLVALCALCACARAPAARRPEAHVTRTAPPHPLALPLQAYLGRLKTIQVRIGTDSYRFLFDTAGGETLITPEVATRVGCKPSGRTVEFRMTGERVEFQQCTGLVLDFEGLKVPHPTIGVFDLMALLPEGVPPLAGVVSLKSFASQTLTLDLKGEVLIVESEASARERIRDMQPLQVRLSTGTSGSALVVFVAAQAHPAPLWLEFDSGNLDRVLLAPHAARLLGLELRDEHLTSQPEALPTQRRWNLPAAPLTLVGQAPESLPIGVQELIYDGVLNASFMEGRVFTLELPRGRMWSTPARPDP
ncbi:hypothetical protein F0U61_06785 [Archangium violaceum]|uniref:hypothetical protein n=1 Tax=Archangium violaceum TaxID=83451 RepID=UPI002B313438|nr:hypothetical protein F0U61_06785 [Archangium violaceum]